MRAFDLARYRNFRTLTSPRPAQFGCLAADAAGELVAAGGTDTFEIYLWSLKSGRLLEVIPGHEGPVADVAFSPSPTSSMLASASWDKTLRLVYISKNTLYTYIVFLPFAFKTILNRSLLKCSTS